LSLHVAMIISLIDGASGLSDKLGPDSLSCPTIMAIASWVLISVRRSAAAAHLRSQRWRVSRSASSLPSRVDTVIVGGG
jgi:hypothetical protein